MAFARLQPRALLREVRSGRVMSIGSSSEPHQIHRKSRSTSLVSTNSCDQLDMAEDEMITDLEAFHRMSATPFWPALVLANEIS